MTTAHAVPKADREEAGTDFSTAIGNELRSLRRKVAAGDRA